MRTHRTPLGRYLDEHKITTVEFAARCSEIAGWRIKQNQVSMWATGTRIPRRFNRQIIAQASRGEVPVDAWADASIRQGGRSQKKRQKERSRRAAHE